MSKNIALIIGSLRKESINRQYANAIVAELGKIDSTLTVQEIQIADLPLYNQDSDTQHIDSYERVRKQVSEADAILIVTPEHNRTIPAALKNLIDIASRPHGKSVWSGKKAAVVTASISTYGGINAAIDVRKSLQALGVIMMVSPEVYLAKAMDNLNDGKVSSERTQQFLAKFAQSFAQFMQ